MTTRGINPDWPEGWVEARNYLPLPCRGCGAVATLLYALPSRAPLQGIRVHCILCRSKWAVDTLDDVDRDWKPYGEDGADQ